MKTRLSKALAKAGIASRRAAEELISAGAVRVNGETIRIPQFQVDPSIDAIEYKSRRIEMPEHFSYYIMNKPKGYLCTHVRRKGEKLVYDLFPRSHLRLFTVGRLDKDTTGLLLVTNDGKFAQRIAHPSYQCEKEYLVCCSESITPDHIKKLMRGCLIEGKWATPKKVEPVSRSKLRITLQEGLKREIRILIKQCHLTLLSLERIRIGKLFLRDLSQGSYREMTAREKACFF